MYLKNLDEELNTTHNKNKRYMGFVKCLINFNFNRDL